jgi:predicted Zn finger-like uncharacterized protein
VLIRCQQCQALFSLQDGVAGAAGTFQVECGRCHAVFDAAAPQRHQPMPPVPRAAHPEVLELSAVEAELTRVLEPGEDDPRLPARRRRRRLWLLAALAVLVIGALAGRGCGDRGRPLPIAASSGK